MNHLLKIAAIFFVLFTQGKVSAEDAILDTKQDVTANYDQQYEEDSTEEFELDVSVLEIKGDVEYGEYLSGDCTACHQINGSYNGIPSIIGWDEENFVWAMHSYKQKIQATSCHANDGGTFIK